MPESNCEESGLYLSEQPLNAGAILAECHHPRAGAIVLFSGEVRNHNIGRSVDYLFYEAYPPLANKMVAALLEEVCSKWELHIAHCVHRYGRVEIGESAVVVVTASSHRAEAYEANRYIIERLKKEIPIWKREHFSDGSVEWSRGG